MALPPTSIGAFLIRVEIGLQLRKPPPELGPLSVLLRILPAEALETLPLDWVERALLRKNPCAASPLVERPTAQLVGAKTTGEVSRNRKNPVRYRAYSA